MRVREIQDLLLLRGVNLAELQFSGASEITVQTMVVRPRTVTVKAVSPGTILKSKKRVCEALLKYLAERSATPQVLIKCSAI